jgi:hypothetical protein
MPILNKQKIIIDLKPIDKKYYTEVHVGNELVADKLIEPAKVKSLMEKFCSDNIDDIRKATKLFKANKITIKEN